MAENKPTKVGGEKEEKKVPMVSIPKADLEAIRTQLDNLTKDRDMLLQVADKKQMSAYYQRNRGRVPSRVRLYTIKDKVVVGWVSTVDIPPQIDPASGRWIPEVQKAKYVFDDGSVSEEMHQVQFTRAYKMVEAEVRGTIRDEVTEKVAFKVVRLDNGKEYTIAVEFVN